MNNLGVIKELLEKYGEDIALNSKLIIALIIFIFINLITTIINIISAHSLKGKEKKITSFNIKEQKRINVFENVYQQLDKLSFFNGKNDANEFLNHIQEVEQYISKNKIYIGKKELKSFYKITDYYKIVVTDFRKKDYNNELILFNKLSELFNK